MKRGIGALVLVALGCARAVPTPSKAPDLPPFTAKTTSEQLNLVFGPQGRVAMLGDMSLVPETMGLDLGQMGMGGAATASKAVWCFEAEDMVSDTLVMKVGVSWWPPGGEPNDASRSITEALMRCLGYLQARPWAHGTVYIREATIPRVEVDGRKTVMQEGTDTLSAALEQAFAFSLGAPFMVRSLAINGGTQDGAFTEEERGLTRKGEGHVITKGKDWSGSVRIVYGAGEAAEGITMMGAKAATVIGGVSYVVASGKVGEIAPSTVSRAALRIKTGFTRDLITMTATMKAHASPGLTCVLRALSNPKDFVPVDGGAPQFPGVDLEAAQKCELNAEEQAMAGTPKK